MSDQPDFENHTQKSEILVEENEEHDLDKIIEKARKMREASALHDKQLEDIMLKYGIEDNDCPKFNKPKDPFTSLKSPDQLLNDQETKILRIKERIKNIQYGRSAPSYDQQTFNKQHSNSNQYQDKYMLIEDLKENCIIEKEKRSSKVTRNNSKQEIPTSKSSLNKPLSRDSLVSRVDSVFDSLNRRDGSTLPADYKLQRRTDTSQEAFHQKQQKIKPDYYTFKTEIDEIRSRRNDNDSYLKQPGSIFDRLKTEYHETSKSRETSQERKSIDLKNKYLTKCLLKARPPSEDSKDEYMDPWNLKNMEQQESANYSIQGRETLLTYSKEGDDSAMVRLDDSLFPSTTNLKIKNGNYQPQAIQSVRRSKTPVHSQKPSSSRGDFRYMENESKRQTLEQELKHLNSKMETLKTEEMEILDQLNQYFDKT